jgi:hypothetical protein
MFISFWQEKRKNIVTNTHSGNINCFVMILILLVYNTLL